ncbi:MAG TPA: hypothetical protein VFO46_26420 [Candidatus Sulfotelmatobacter sp.]|nr:hypothetical protein [Candidatus Sulfotelmatobacter sp.]
MTYTKTIVCLANSRKLTGRCVAGKEWDGRAPGPWCRPVSARDRGELTAERWYATSWRDPRLLDLIQVGLLGPHPSGCQTENHLVDTNVRWKFAGRIPAQRLLPGLDHPEGALWVNGESTSGGLNDRVHAAVADEQQNSLVLVRPDRLVIKVNTEAANTEHARRRVRGQFSLAGHEYILSITDPIVEGPILRQPDGFTTELQRPILCISLSEKFVAQNACYKLIAGVIPTC